MLRDVTSIVRSRQSTSQPFVSSQQQGSLPASDGLPIASTGNGLASQSHIGCESLIAVEARQRAELMALEEALVTNVAIENEDSGRHGKAKRRHHAHESYDDDEDSCDDSSDDSCDDSSDDSDDSCDDSSDDSCDDSSEDYRRHRRHKKHKKHRHHHKKHKKHKKKKKTKKDEKSTSNVFSNIRGVNIGTTFTNIQITGGNATAPEQPSSATPTTNLDLIRSGSPGWGGLGDRPVEDVRDPAARNAASCCYIIHNSRSLPTIDSTKSVKNVILPPRALAICNRVLFATKRWLPFVYMAGMVFSIIVPFAKVEEGRHMGILVLVLQVLPSITSLLVLRYDMVRLLFTTFEFWYMTVKNVLASVLLGFIYHDIRVCVPVMAAIGLFVPFLIDATYRGASMSIIGSVGAAFAISCSLVLVNFGLIDDMQTRVVFETRKCRVDVDDAFLNIMSTIAVILIRNAIRKYQSLTPKPQASEDTRTKSVATCITYHCRIELREATHNTIGPYIAKPTPSSARMVQLRFVPVDTVFDATNVLIPRWFAMVSTNSWRQNTQIWLRVAGAVGLVSTIVGILLPPSLHSTIASILALVATTLFVGVYSAHFQRQLLIRLIHSFDYAFLSAHFSLLHIGACDLVYWDSRVLTIMASWLWIHWLITLDAVTPVMKHKLGYCKHMAILIALMYFFEQICLGVELVFLDYRHLQDRVLFTIQLEDHAKPVRVIPLVLGRLVTTVLWTSRILWRILDRRGSELVMLLGHVEYDDVELVRRRKRNNESSHDSTSVSHSRNLRLKLMLLVVTYEFWFMTVVNLASTVLLSVYMPDIRLVNAWAMCIGHEVQTVIDATIASQREFVFGTIVSATATGMLLIFVVLGVMDGVKNQALFSVNGHTLVVTDLLVNGLSTQLLILMRNAYRRRAAIKEHGNKSTVVQCLTYRCPVRLRVRRRTDSTDFSTATPSETDKLPRLTASFIASAKMVPMQCRPVGLKTSTEKLVFSVISRWILHSPSPIRLHVWRVWALVLRVTGILLTIVSFIPATPLVWRVSGLVVTSVFCFGCGAMYHRQLLRYLVFSFDFVFLSLQFTLIHFCLCDLLSWDTRVVSVVSCWLWIHWILTFDCMPPSVKAKWGLRHSFVLWIAVLCVLAHIVVGVQVAFGHRDTLRDRAVLSIEVFGQRMTLNVLSTMLSRMLVTFFWSCRMVWRLWHRKENELLIIQGTVTYVNNRRKLKRDEDELKRFKSLGGRRKASLRQLMTRVGPVVSSVSRVAAEPRTSSLLPSTATD
ncbi:hypothetical protein Poli38472_003429 [Pythium oligandrum]|uniref:Transmembrane protein n=1 Tax=Pythium oligandrum TaxID=41045 RepID=A0A8K1C6I1_PYTOL|nr:hypothetical protein Poli38472_003429 [Pythium oligandrum]|eukprot:TMW57504.1 hypothetical protein Poli38472_003429 [Pythium oligandrum]